MFEVWRFCSHWRTSCLFGTFHPVDSDVPLRGHSAASPGPHVTHRHLQSRDGERHVSARVKPLEENRLVSFSHQPQNQRSRNELAFLELNSDASKRWSSSGSSASEPTSKPGHIMNPHQTSQPLSEASSSNCSLYIPAPTKFLLVGGSSSTLKVVFPSLRTLCKLRWSGGSLSSSLTKSCLFISVSAAGWSHFSRCVSCGEPGSAALRLLLSPTGAPVRLSNVQTTR